MACVIARVPVVPPRSRVRRSVLARTAAMASVMTRAFLAGTFDGWSREWLRRHYARGT